MLIFKNIRIVDPSQALDRRADVFFHDGQLALSPPVRDATAPEIVDGTELLLTPGLLDLHAHFREPGHEEAEDIASGCACAARGGFTRVVTMPNTNPPVDRPEAVRFQARGAKGIRVLPSACLTLGRSGETVADLESLAAAGAVAFTDDGRTVADSRVMAEAMRRAARLNKVVMDHAVDPSRAGSGVMRAGRLAQTFGLSVFPEEAELAAVERDIELARETQCALHLQHLSCAGSVERLENAAGRPGNPPVSAEVTPHHLALAIDELARPDPRFKMNPPLGTSRDRAALRRAVLAGTIACFATDHAPHSAAAKALDFERAAFGVIGLETAAAVTYECMVAREGMSLSAWVAAWTVNPAGILGISFPGVRFNAPADCAIFRISAPRPISVGDLVSKSRNAPFIGFESRLHPAMTCCEGRVLWCEEPLRRGMIGRP